MKTLVDFIKNLKSFYQFYKDYKYNGAECEFIIENYQEVLCSRTKNYEQADILCKFRYWRDGQVV